MIRLTVEQVRMLHRDLIAETGGIEGVRDEGLLDSALQLPFQTFDGQALYPSIQQKAARLCSSLVTQEELISLGLSLAEGKLTCDDVLRWITTHQYD